MLGRRGEALDRAVLCLGEIKHSKRFLRSPPMAGGMMARMRYTGLALLMLVWLWFIVSNLCGREKELFGPLLPSWTWIVEKEGRAWKRVNRGTHTHRKAKNQKGSIYWAFTDGSGVWEGCK